MYIKEETEKYLQELVQKTFQLNAFLDNCVYNLDYLGYEHTQKILHESFAHLPPVWADKITEILSCFGVRCVRLGLEDETTEYNDLGEVFSDIVRGLSQYREGIKNCIEVAEISKDLSIKVFLEEYYKSLDVWFKQALIWEKKTQQFTDAEFDVHFSDFLIK